jgi:hypothetical protein
MESRLAPNEIEYAIWIATAIAAVTASILAALTFRVQRLMATTRFRGAAGQATVAILAVGDYAVARVLLSAIAERLLAGRYPESDGLTVSLAFVEIGVVPMVTPLISMALTWIILSRRARRRSAGDSAG